MLRSNKYGSGIFWIFQIIGWALVSLMLGYWNKNMNGVELNVTVKASVIFLTLGVLLSFFYRQYMVREGWLKLSMAKLFPRILIGSVLFGVIFTLIISSILDLLFDSIQPIIKFPYLAVLGFIINTSLIFMLWSSIYLNYNYYKNYEKEEIKNLKLLASNREVELQNLKSQLNPHFIFNAMNSIRALIQEDPNLAQNAITKLSSILRNSLISNKRQYVSLKDEIDIVEKYLSLEKIRYEERLNYYFDIEPNLLNIKVPPMVISTLVENAVKHGIGTKKDGGDIGVRIEEEGGKLKIQVLNPGVYQEGVIRGTGIGIINTKKRLNLLFADNYTFTIINEDPSTVVTTIIMPKILES